MPLEYRVNWAGTSVTGNGVSVFHGRTDGVATTGQAAQSLADRVRKFFLDVGSRMPAGIAFTFPAEVTELDTTTGVLLDVHAITAPAVVNSSGAAGVHSRAAGARVDWNTGAITAGRRLRGRTFLVPCSSTTLDTTGTLSTTGIAEIQTGANNYLNTGVFTQARPVVWSRTHGIAADILSATIADKTTVLRSRRD